SARVAVVGVEVRGERVEGDQEPVGGGRGRERGGVRLCAGGAVGAAGRRGRLSFALAPLAPLARLTSVVVLACRSRTNRSPLVSPSSGSRFEANEWKATKRPSAEIAGVREKLLSALAPVAPLARLTSVVVFACRSRTKTFPLVSPSSGSRFEAADAKATKRPSAEIAGVEDPSSPL